jgi:formylmethanofuran dehydrogenase subunit E
MMRRTARLFLVTVLAGTGLLSGNAPPSPPQVEARPSVDELARLPHAPVLRVIDTVSSLGPLEKEPQTVTLMDLVRFHGHACDGLVVAAAGIAAGLRELFPGGIVDRTDLFAVSNASVCYGDVAAYLTGARAQYGSLIMDRALGDEWILHRRSTRRTLRVRLRSEFKPTRLPALEQELRGKECDPDLIMKVQDLQSRFARDVLSVPSENVFIIDLLEDFPYPASPPRPDAVKAGCGMNRP